MRRFFIMSTALLLAAAAATPEAIAQQGQKKSAKCPANFQQLCMERCSARGGQIRLCPQYCSKQERERCPR